MPGPLHGNGAQGLQVPLDKNEIGRGCKQPGYHFGPCHCCRTPSILTPQLFLARSCRLLRHHLGHLCGAFLQRQLPACSMPCSLNRQATQPVFTSKSRRPSLTHCCTPGRIVLSGLEGAFAHEPGQEAACRAAACAMLVTQLGVGFWPGFNKNQPKIKTSH